MADPIVADCTEDEWYEHLEHGSGLCLACGEWRVGDFGDVPPDGENYECHECGAYEVCGAELALSSGHIRII